jgi:hypothetical protein
MRGVFVVKKGIVALNGSTEGPASAPATSGAEGSFSTYDDDNDDDDDDDDNDDNHVK